VGLLRRPTLQLNESRFFCYVGCNKIGTGEKHFLSSLLGKRQRKGFVDLGRKMLDNKDK
jgi:hypothetical protein